MYNLKEFKEVFDPVLSEFINERVDKFLEKTTDPFIKDFISYSKKLVTNGGKRIRPYMAYLSYKSFGGEDDKEALRLFKSLEVFHNFALVHDDIMDRSKTRHGVETIHSFVTKKLKEQGRIGDLVHSGNSQAILVGDLLFSWSLEIWDNTNLEKEKLMEAKKYFYQMIDEVCLGQIIDVDLTTRERVGYSLIEEKMKLKTASYSFIRPLQIGAALAGGSKEIEQFCTNLGTLLGVSFQIQDDLLDIIGDPKSIRKTPLLDITERQHTFFTNYIFENGSEEQIRRLNTIFGKNIDIKHQKEVENLFRESGAIDEGKKIIMENLKKAEKIVNSSDIENGYKKSFLEIIEIIKQRQS
jgi:geranylgeranyl diphosphate synthase type I